MIFSEIINIIITIEIPNKYKYLLFLRFKIKNIGNPINNDNIAERVPVRNILVSMRIKRNGNNFPRSF